MSAFEINLTPQRLKNKKQNESREPTNVIMAPFTAKAIVQFEDVPVTKAAKRILKVINPSEDEIVVTVTKTINPLYNVTIDWTENVIPANAEVEMQMIWNPQIQVVCKESIHISDNRNFRKEVVIILKSASCKPTKNVRKFPNLSSGVGSHLKTLRLKSPTGGYKVKPIAQTTQQRRRLSHLSNNAQQTIKTEKVVPTQQKPPQLQAKMEIKQEKISPLTERNKYINEKQFQNVQMSTTKLLGSSVVAGLKENVSPLTPGNVMHLFDQIHFTPAMEDVPKTTSHIDYLSSWPTPINREGRSNDSYIDTSKQIREIQPRRLIVSEFSEDEQSPISRNPIPRIKIEEVNVSYDESDDGCAKEIAALLNNKTFDLKPLDKSDSILNASQEHLDITPNEYRLLTTPLNKTTTILAATNTRPLEMIEEEVSPSTSISLQKTYKVNVETSEKDLKRDIKIVGTPLRKFSESMKDLSMKSPEVRISIQGSMPNLSDMQSIRSIEQNRYYNTVKQKQQSDVCVNTHKLPTSESTTLKAKHICLDDSDVSNTSQTSLASHADLMFNQNEILAQSSRFNLNEIGQKSRKNSPVRARVKIVGSKIGSPGVTPPPKPLKKSPDVTSHKRFRDSSILDSPTNDSVAINHLSVPKNTGILHISPPKRAKIETEFTVSNWSSSSRGQRWSYVQPKKFKLAKTLSLVKRPITPRKVKEEPRVKLYDTDLYLSCINPDPFAASTTVDPFLASTMYLDERAIEKHQIDFKKWLNALVSIPPDLNTDCDNKIDVGRLFNDVRNKDLILAPTKEEQSMNYLTKYRLESLRQAAVQLFLSEEMQTINSKVSVYVNKNAIRIRSDRNLHLDIVMQRQILELLLCFNSLWLRLGLEVVYGEKIHLHSCSDIVGLSTFILNRLFKDKFLEQKYSRAYTLSEEYSDHIKKFTLQKMLILLLFLDRAKSLRIVKHNPCLFVKKSPHKETKDILLRFSCELLANVGDITRELKRLGYVLSHKQSFIDEFDYAFNNLAVDLRDGIRFTRIMEIILLRDDLTKQLRLPAISRLQRLHNVNLGLRALAEADFELKGQICAADIVDAHREKTLSLLWQIIYKFRSPKFHAAAAVLQCWWRNSWLRVCIRRRIRLREQQRRDAAATMIQAVFRGYLSRKFAKIFKWERTSAAVILQKCTRRYLAQKKFFQTLNSVLLIQRWYRAFHYGVEIRRQFLFYRNNVIILQRWIRRISFARKLEQVAPLIKSLQAEAKLRHEKAILIQRFFKCCTIRRKLQHIVYEIVRVQRQLNLENRSAARIQSFFKMIHLRRLLQRKRESAVKIQRIWRSHVLTKVARAQFVHKRNCIVRIQQYFRSYQCMQQYRWDYVKLREIVIAVQTRFRAKKLAALQRQKYLQLRLASIVIQQRFRANMRMHIIREEFCVQRRAIIMCQRRIRATQMMKLQRSSYQKLRLATIYIQRSYRSRLEMKARRSDFHKIRSMVIRIQQKIRATFMARRIRAEYISLHYYTIMMQQTFRANRQMQIDRSAYLQKRQYAVAVQRRFRASCEMKLEHNAFLLLKKCVLLIQRKFRANKHMRLDRAKFQSTKQAVIYIQQRFRSYLLTKRQREQFLQQRKGALIIQRRFRAYIVMRLIREHYQQMQNSAIYLQRRYRAYKHMKAVRSAYEHSRLIIIATQRYFRAKLLARETQSNYQRMRKAAICIQRRFRANKIMRQNKMSYLEQRFKVVRIQRHFRSYLAMKQQRKEFLTKKHAAVRIQLWFRSVLHMRCEQRLYHHIRQSVITIQVRWRASLKARKQREIFLNTKKQIILIQRKFRATLIMRLEQNSYKQLQQSAIIIQRRYRGRLEMLKMRSQYLLIKSLVICIQRKFRAHKEMLVSRRTFLLLKSTTIYIQQVFRGRIQTRIERQRYHMLQNTALGLQTHIRGLLSRRRYQALMTPEMIEFLRQKKAVKIIQRFWRGYRVRKKWQNLRIIAIRSNIRQLKVTASVDKSVRWKVLDAVRILRGRFNASEALHVLMRLDRVSRTVPHLIMEHFDFISTFCYGIMAQAIRSEVDKQLIEYCSRIILNLARYNSTTANTFQEGGLVTIAQMLLRWCDKDCDIFNTLCTLIWVFSHSTVKRRKIREFMTNTEAIYLVRETKKLVARKEKMKKNVRKPACSPRCSTRNAVLSTRALPCLDPDYGVIRNKPYIFISSVFAFDTILCKLGIEIN